MESRLTNLEAMLWLFLRDECGQEWEEPKHSNPEERFEPCDEFSLDFGSDGDLEDESRPEVVTSEVATQESLLDKVQADEVIEDHNHIMIDSDSMLSDSDAILSEEYDGHNNAVGLRGMVSATDAFLKFVRGAFGKNPLINDEVPWLGSFYPSHCPLLFSVFEAGCDGNKFVIEDEFGDNDEFYTECKSDYEISSLDLFFDKFKIWKSDRKNYVFDPGDFSMDYDAYQVFDEMHNNLRELVKESIGVIALTFSWNYDVPTVFVVCSAIIKSTRLPILVFENIDRNKATCGVYFLDPFDSAHTTHLDASRVIIFSSNKMIKHNHSLILSWKVNGGACNSMVLDDSILNPCNSAVSTMVGIKQATNHIFYFSGIVLTKNIPKAILIEVMPLEFSLVDQLISQVQALRILELNICSYKWRDFKRKENTGNSSSIFKTFSFIIAMIPYWCCCFQELTIWVSDVLIVVIVTDPGGIIGCIPFLYNYKAYSLYYENCNFCERISTCLVEGGPWLFGLPKEVAHLKILFNLHNLLETPYNQFYVYFKALNLAVNGEGIEHVIPSFAEMDNFLNGPFFVAKWAIYCCYCTNNGHKCVFPQYLCREAKPKILDKVAHLLIDEEEIFCYGPSSMHFLNMEEVAFALEDNYVEVEIGVVGNISYVKVSSLYGTLVRLNMYAPLCKNGEYNDFNSLYMAVLNIGSSLPSAYQVIHDGNEIFLTSALGWCIKGGKYLSTYTCSLDGHFAQYKVAGEDWSKLSKTFPNIQLEDKLIFDGGSIDMNRKKGSGPSPSDKSPGTQRVNHMAIVRGRRCKFVIFS